MNILSKIDEFNVDHHRLRYILHLPDTQYPPPLVVGSHGLEGSMASAKQKVLAKILPQHGIAYFRFDHRGCGKSEGNFFIETSLKKRTEDLVAAVANAINTGLTSRRLGLFGSSMGGATCINAWEKIKILNLELCGAVICSAPIRSKTITKLPLHLDANQPLPILNFFKKNLNFDTQEKLRDLHNVLIFHGDADEVVPVSNAYEILNTIQSPKRLIIQTQGKHIMSSRRDQIEFEKKTVSWFKKILF